MHVLKFIVANNILRLRTDAEMSREELGEKIRYSEEFILKWERAEAMPDDEELALLAEALGVTADYLLNPHDEWVSKEEKEYLENAATLAPRIETKNLRAEEEAVVEAPPEKQGKQKKKKSLLPLILSILLASFGIFYLGTSMGLIGCEAQEAEANTIAHVHEYGDWQIYSEATVNSEGEMRKYCHGCEEYLVKALPVATQGIFYEKFGEGKCIVTGIAHGPQTNASLSRIVIPPYFIDEVSGEELTVFAIEEDFLSSLGDKRERISEIILPESLQIIGPYAFSNTGISDIELPEGLLNIGDYAFAGCKRLSGIVLPENLAYIGEGAFSECGGLTQVRVLTKNITEIEPYTFRYCINLESINGIDSVKVIDDGAFDGCVSLKGIDVFSDNLERIEAYAFQSCETLDYVTIGERVCYIGENAFGSCKGLLNVEFYFSNSAVNEKISLGMGAFYGCENIAKLDLKRVVYIGDYAFANCTSLKSVVTEAERIYEGAFSGCAELDIITLGEGLEYIGVSAFSDCHNMVDITIPASVKTLSDYAFRDCTSLYRFTTNGSIEELGDDVFDNCENLKELSLYDMSGKMGNLFAGNTNITDVAIRGGEIPAGAFRDCTSLLYISLYDGVTSIGDYAFYGVSSSLGFLIPSTLTHIGEYAFANTNMYDFTIGANVEYVGEFAFFKSTLTRVTIESGRTEFAGYTFANCGNLEAVVFPEDMTRICDGMFSGCTSNQFNNIILPESVTVIGNYAFSECGKLCEIKVSKNLTEIGYRAFDYCHDLNKINFGGTKEDWENINKLGDWNLGVYGDINVNCTNGYVIVSPI